MADIIHLIRHGQSAFNAAWERDNVDPMIIDAPLTERGFGQAASIRSDVAKLGIEAVLASPLTRAIQTATHLADGLDVPIHVDPLHREFVWSSCDIGRSPADLASDFPHLSFDHLSDPWWWCPSGDTTLAGGQSPGRNLSGCGPRPPRTFIGHRRTLHVLLAADRHHDAELPDPFP